MISKCNICGEPPSYTFDDRLLFPHIIYHYPNKKICNNKFCIHSDSIIIATRDWNVHNKKENSNE